MKHFIDFVFKNFGRRFAVKSSKVVHRANLCHILIFLAGFVVCGQSFGADIKPEFFKRDSDHVDAGFENLLDFDSSFIIVELYCGKVSGESGPEVYCRLPTFRLPQETKGVFKLDASDTKSEAVRNKTTKQSSDYPKPTRNKSNIVNSRFHLYLISIAAGSLGILAGLLILLFILPNAALTGAERRSGGASG